MSARGPSRTFRGRVPGGRGKASAKVFDWMRPTGRRLGSGKRDAKSELPRRNAAPAPERVCERADLAVAQQPSDFGDRQFVVRKVAPRQSGPQFSQYRRKQQAFGVKLA